MVERKVTLTKNSSNYLSEHSYGKDLDWYHDVYDVTQELEGGRLTLSDRYISEWKPSTNWVGSNKAWETYHKNNGKLRRRQEYEWGIDNDGEDIKVVKAIEQFDAEGFLILRQEYGLNSGKQQFVGFDSDRSINILGYYRRGVQEGKWVRKTRKGVYVSQYSNGEEIGDEVRHELPVWAECLDEFGVRS
ncbi:MAG: hypothetical protein VKK07_01175 [Merismopediaceae bacterium]|nr:hypothetical protein [Merismopediaceae bacterium]